LHKKAACLASRFSRLIGNGFPMDALQTAILALEDIDFAGKTGIFHAN
jgi:hypothetical protein